MKRVAQFLAHACLMAFMAGCSKADSSAVLYFTGACDASAAVAFDNDLFVVANDEDNILRVYSRHRPGPPVSQVDFNPFLRPEKKAEESDLEGAAQLGDRIYWITSHGRNAKGKERETRHRFFATTGAVSNGAVQLEAIGYFYPNLLDDMLADPRLAALNLQHAAELAPKSAGALNIEGLTGTPDGHLLIGFRNPVPTGRAILLPLLNPDDLIHGKRAKFGEAITLDLGGLGIRSISYWRDAYLIVAGPTDGVGESYLYRWRHGQEPERIPAPKLDGLNPEAISFPNKGPSTDFLVVSDDGTARVGNQDCKKVKDPNRRKFRAVAMSL
jgi:hypothetical protein